MFSEFDIAAFVVYVGEVYTEAHQKKQWVFVTDESASELISKESSDTLLAISFYLPYTEWDSFAPINNNVAGSVVSTYKYTTHPSSLTCSCSFVKVYVL